METKQKLPVKFKEKWVAALRSGKYKQGESYLYNADDNSWCCIGVAANVCGIGKDKLDEGGYVENSSYKLMEAVKSGKKYPTMLIGSGSENALVNKLAGFNDGFDNSKPKSFKWIANYIERYL